MPNWVEEFESASYIAYANVVAPAGAAPRGDAAVQVEVRARRAARWAGSGGGAGPQGALGRPALLCPQNTARALHCNHLPRAVDYDDKTSAAPLPPQPPPPPLPRPPPLPNPPWKPQAVDYDDKTSDVPDPLSTTGGRTYATMRVAVGDAVLLFPDGACVCVGGGRSLQGPGWRGRGVEPPRGSSEGRAGAYSGPFPHAASAAAPAARPPPPTHPPPPHPDPTDAPYIARVTGILLLPRSQWEPFTVGGVTYDSPGAFLRQRCASDAEWVEAQEARGRLPASCFVLKVCACVGGGGASGAAGAAALGWDGGAWRGRLAGVGQVGRGAAVSASLRATRCHPAPPVVTRGHPSSPGVTRQVAYFYRYKDLVTELRRRRDYDNQVGGPVRGGRGF
jgi:hypothetical protein